MTNYELGVVIGVLLAVLVWCVAAFLSLKPRPEQASSATAHFEGSRMVHRPRQAA